MKGTYSSSYRIRSGSDPLARVLQPPPNETPAEREERLQQEQEAKKRSDNIDRMLRDADKQNRKRKAVRVLLLGQSESGKSTTLKRKSKLFARHRRRIIALYSLSPCRYPNVWSVYLGRLQISM